MVLSLYLSTFSFRLLHRSLSSALLSECSGVRESLVVLSAVLVLCSAVRDTIFLKDPRNSSQCWHLLDLDGFGTRYWQVLWRMVLLCLTAIESLLTSNNANLLSSLPRHGLCLLKLSKICRACVPTFSSILLPQISANQILSLSETRCINVEPKIWHGVEGETTLWHFCDLIGNTIIFILVVANREEKGKWLAADIAV